MKNEKKQDMTAELAEGKILHLYSNSPSQLSLHN